MALGGFLYCLTHQERKEKKKKSWTIETEYGGRGHEMLFDACRIPSETFDMVTCQVTRQKKKKIFFFPFSFFLF